MEVMLQNILPVVLIVFMMFLCALCLFAVIVIARDIVHESARNRRERRYERELAREAEAVKEPEPVKLPEPAKEPEPIKEPEPVAETPAELQEEPAVDEDGAVTFATHTLTIEEKYAALSLEFRRYFDDVVRHTLAKEGIKELKHTGSYDYKIGAYRVLRIMIKRNEIVCEFTFIDRDFADLTSANNVRVKQSATTIRISEASAVGVAKDCVDRVCAQIAEDKEHKKELAREKRRERRRAQAEAESAGAAKAETANV
jgi:hypothetical protein